jgi:hypothetical protein
MNSTKRYILKDPIPGSHGALELVYPAAVLIQLVPRRFDGEIAKFLLCEIRESKSRHLWRHFDNYFVLLRPWKSVVMYHYSPAAFSNSSFEPHLVPEIPHQILFR